MSKLTMVFSCDKCGAMEDRQPTYCGYDKESNQRVAFFFEIPGGDIGKNHDTEFFDFVKYIEDNIAGFEKAKYWRMGTLHWMISNKKINEVYKAILPVLAETGFIDEYYHHYHYVIHRFLDNIYISDVVKCRPRLKAQFTNAFNVCPKEYLSDEIALLPNLKLVVAFGNKTFNAFSQMEEYRVEEVCDNKKPELEFCKEHKTHGNIYKCIKKNNIDDYFFIIRSLHPSGARVNKPTERNEMIQLLIEAIKYCGGDFNL